MDEGKWILVGYWIGVVYMLLVLTTIVCYYQRQELRRLRAANTEYELAVLKEVRQKLREKGLPHEDQPAAKSTEKLD